nr:hypothetical protein [uncultured Rhodopila sp.]
MGDTQVGVTRVALRLLVRAVSAAKAGGQIAIIGADGKVCLLSGSWDDVQTGARA